MGISRRIGLAVVTAAIALGAGIGRASQPPARSAGAPVDEKLLEFLGSVDSSADPTRPDDGGWLAYLSKIDIGKVAKAAPAQARAGPKPASSAASADKPSG